MKVNLLRSRDLLSSGTKVGAAGRFLVSIITGEGEGSSCLWRGWILCESEKCESLGRAELGKWYEVIKQVESEKSNVW